jgi:fluoroacetyl-CoA thioesterase
MTFAVGASAQVVATVGADDTAIALGSGDVPVLATPRLIAWCEAATVDAAAATLPTGQTTVGARVEFDHLGPSEVGTEVTVIARLTAVRGRTLEFSVEAIEKGRTVGRGTVRRVLVDREQFLA